MMKRATGLIGPATLAALIAAGCGGNKNPLLVPNEPPEVELFAQRVDHSASGPYEYRLQWVGRDPDGQVDHYVFAMGSPAEDLRAAAWTATVAREKAMSFPARIAAPVRATGETVEPGIFSVRAVDARGAMSSPAQVAFFDGALAPRVEILSPRPNPLVRYPVSPSFCVEWTGTAFGKDSAATRVAEYKYKVLSSTTEVTAATARQYPDSVRRYYAPRNWVGWVSRPGPITSAILQDLVMDQDYVFVITCFDRDGDYDPIFSFNTNMLYMRVAGSAATLPRINVFNQFIQYSSSGFDPSRVVNLEIPADQAITFNWSATPAASRQIRGYRWAVDLANPDQLAGHWSPWDLETTSATVGPFNPPAGGSETHTLYIEARDDWSCTANDVNVSLVTLKLNVIRLDPHRELLIVDDTRLQLDRINPGTTCSAASNRPIGLWPTQAELDTFLYARGGVPWRCYPPGTNSTPGIFSGYPFDTLGTNRRTLDLTVPLSTLSQYRNVIWLTDGSGALNSKPGTDPGDIGGPQTAMRYMNSNSTTNTLATYVRLGGRVWIAGAGAATASMINFNRVNNDNTLPAPATLTFSFNNQELVPGRFVYDQAHWRSEFKQYRVNNGRIRRYLGRFQSSPGIYAGLPVEIQIKSPATDPFPPNRMGQSPGVFYQTQFDIEFLSAANEILEDVDPGPGENVQPTLDTLYKVTAPSLQPDSGPFALQSVVMTYYHNGADNPPFITTGFSLWNFRRAQCLGLVDFVLQQLWGMTRQSAVTAVAPTVGRPAQPRGETDPVPARVARGD
jgi:hypothetical protein